MLVILSTCNLKNVWIIYIFQIDLWKWFQFLCGSYLAWILCWNWSTSINSIIEIKVSMKDFQCKHKNCISMPLSSCTPHHMPLILLKSYSTFFTFSLFHFFTFSTNHGLTTMTFSPCSKQWTFLWLTMTTCSFFDNIFIIKYGICEFLLHTQILQWCKQTSFFIQRQTIFKTQQTSYNPKSWGCKL